MSRASAIAAARLQRSQRRLGVEQLAPVAPEDAKKVFAEAYEAFKKGDIDRGLQILEPVHESDLGQPFEMKALPGMLLLSSEGSQGFTMLHQAAWHGSQRGVRELLRLGANAAQPNANGESSAAVAAAQQHDAVAAMLQAHNEAWAGWGLVELSALACVYHAEDRFADGESYLRRLIDRDKARHANDSPQSLFRRPLPSGLSLLDISKRLSTLGASLVRQEFGGDAEGGDGGEGGAGLDGAIVDNPAGGAADDDELKDEWPDDAWVPPCAGFMVCVLCRGRSGVAGRFGAASALQQAQLRHPLAVCHPCQRNCGLQASDGSAALSEGWVGETTGAETLRLEAHVDKEGRRVAQLVHPILGDLGC